MPREPRSRLERTTLEVELPLLGESSELVADWDDEARHQLVELFEDAHTELQREMLHRGLAAGRTLRELHSFADAIRGLDDEAIFKECTPPRTGFPLQVLLTAQADPLAAFELNGNELRHASARGKKKTAEAVRLPPQLMVERTFVPVRGAARFDASSDVDAKAPDAREIGRSGERAAPADPVQGRFAEELFNDAGRALDRKFQEQAVDVGAFTLERAMPLLADALARGVPVPAILGREPGDFRRYAIFLQVQTSGRNRAYQLFDPVAQEAVWANEGDLLNRSELPFSDKIFRRVTALALPKLPPSRDVRDSAFEDRG